MHGYMNVKPSKYHR